MGKASGRGGRGGRGGGYVERKNPWGNDTTYTKPIGRFSGRGHISNAWAVITTWAGESEANVRIVTESGSELFGTNVGSISAAKKLVSSISSKGATGRFGEIKPVR